MCKIQLDDKSVVNIYGYDEIADILYRDNIENIFAEGRIDNNMMIEVTDIY